MRKIPSSPLVFLSFCIVHLLFIFFGVQANVNSDEKSMKIDKTFKVRENEITASN